MASSQQGEDNTTSANRAQDINTSGGDFQAPNTKTTIQGATACASNIAPPVPARQVGLRGSRWTEEEVFFMCERLAEESRPADQARPDWIGYARLLNAEFQARPPLVIDGQQVQRPVRTREQIRQHFRLLRHVLQRRLDDQREVGKIENAAEHLLHMCDTWSLPSGDEEESEGEGEDGEVEAGSEGEGDESEEDEE